VILLTDGEENIATARKPEEIAPLHAGQLCRELGVKVYAIAAGLGSRSPAGEWVEIDTTLVRRLAATAGGRFFEARDAGAVAGVYAEINALERVEFKEPRTIVEEEFLPFLAAAVALLLASRLLQSTVLAVMP
jgi:Ca-activated chloride channel family protein